MPKSLAVLSPAGSGKTQALARRYIELLKAMPEPKKPERILTITFTKKAAAEMKERIFRILKQEDPRLYDLLRSRVLKLRITTIDSFCLSLLQRFALTLGLEPDLTVLADPLDLWANSQYDTLMRIAESGTRSPGFDSLLELVSEQRMQGWSLLTRSFQEFYSHRAAVERARPVDFDFSDLARAADRLRTDPHGLARIADYALMFPPRFDLVTVLGLHPPLAAARREFLTSSGECRSAVKKPALHAWYQAMYDYYCRVETIFHQDRFHRQFELFRTRFLAEFDRRKHEQGQLDFTDLELESYRLLTSSEHWSNILLAFDEHTDHILVDEFQDTNFLQWGIISKLSEEWRSGQGRKTEQGIEPTIFLVGDDKQSIYLFRGANVEVFADARNTLATGLGDRYEFKVNAENYRSLGAIIDFTNHVFSRLMNPPDNAPAWQTRYHPFRKCRKDNDPGRVELILGLNGGNIPERRAREADVLARRIRALNGSHTVYEDGRPVPCDWKHIVILLRQLTHLTAFELALREQGIPYLVQRGRGFYQEREVQLLMNLLAVLVDPYDDFNLYALLRSPLFQVREPDLLFVSGCPGCTFFERLQSYAGSCAGEPQHTLVEVIGRLEEWVQRTGRRPLSETVEEVLTRQQGWQALWEPQRQANVCKFLRLLENAERSGLTPLRIKESFDRAAAEPEGAEAKAAIDVRGQNVVQVMTIHAAKGLQFPVVFCPGLDHDLGFASGSLLVQERSAEDVEVSWLPEPSLRRQDARYLEYSDKLREEAKRLFYVAVTRARDMLVLSGIAKGPEPQPDTWLAWLSQALGLTCGPDAFIAGAQPDGTIHLSLDEAGRLGRAAPSYVTRPAPEPDPEERVAPVPARPRLRIIPVTRHTATEHKRHGDEAIAFGTVMHTILERIANGILQPGDEAAVTRTAERLFAIEGAAADPARVIAQLELLKQHNLLAIALPQADARAEMPFQYRGGDTTYSGRIDRLIITPQSVSIYDYKTFPVAEAELEGLAADYASTQMDAYRRAVQTLYPDRPVRAYLLFTALPRLIELK
jgi:ATP-dependent helicase/nuclease subunit A